MTGKSETGGSSKSGTGCVEVTGHMSRADWDLVYLTARRLANYHELNVE